MPTVSEAQKRAMEAAAHGRSTLGIPKAVGEEFVGKDAKGHAAGTLFVAPDGDVLLLRRSSAETNYAGHWALPGGGGEDGESPEDTAAREAKEEMGDAPEGVRKILDRRISPTGIAFHTFAQPVDEKFVPKLNDEHSGYAWAPLDQLPEPLHPGVKATLHDRLGLAADMTPEDWKGLRDGFSKWTREEEGEPEHAQDRFAFDRASVRTYDKDGHLHVGLTNVSKANVCPYNGSEIPNWQSLGLDPQKVYDLYRDPRELEKGAETLDGKPLLFAHKPTSADDHQGDLVVGAMMNPAWQAPYLKSELVVWPGEAIEAIKDGSQKELSCGYRYRADMTPGTAPDGERYDGVMRDIIFNHCALVEEGRAGPDVVVGDSKHQERTHMSKIVLSQKAALAQGALIAYLTPKLAQDARIDLTPIVAKVTAKNWLSIKPTIAADIRKAAVGKLAKDASLEDMHGFMDRLDKEEPVEAADAEETEEEKKARLSKAAADEDDPDAMDEEETDEEKAARMAKRAADKAARDAAAKDAEKDLPTPGEAKDKDMVSTKAMDAALKKVAADTESATMKRLGDIRTAERAVAPLIGEVTIGLDSADVIYAAALKAKGVEITGVHPSAYPAMVELLNKQAADAGRRSNIRLAQDAAPASDRAEFEKTHGIPTRRIRNLG